MVSISVIEENAEFAFVLAGHLEKLNRFKVISVYHFLYQAEKGLADFPADIVIVDIKQHSGCGIAFIEGMIRENCKSKFLVFTHKQDDETVFKALAAGAHGYLLKDSSPEKLSEALVELSNGAAPMSAPISRKLLAYFNSRQKEEMQCDALSTREKEIMRQVSRGLIYKEIANSLGIQRETVKKHVANIYIKLKVQNRVEAINKFYRQ
ncbi:MAG: response regulator transcription factor [Bacteroidetes bacterium]|nr:response regulator transcription factor [Bacteroidota bacterium]MBS1974353.1 response regulator transcription factor [Bacteroidota bacterium]